MEENTQIPTDEQYQPNTDAQSAEPDSIEKLTEEQQQGIRDLLNLNLDPNLHEEEIAKLKVQLEEQKDKYLRLYADFDNYKKRNAKERLETILTASKDIIKELLPVIDDFDRAIKALETTEEVKLVKEGMNLIHAKLNKTLESKGLKAIEAKGQEFNVELHEALTEIPVPTDDLVGKVVDEIEKGYYLNDKIIRFAKVVVGKANTPQA